MPTPCRTFIVDDDADVLALIAMEIEMANDGLTVAGTATCGDEAIGALADTDPDVIVLDYMMPDSNGLEVAAKILYDRPEQHIVLFSAFITPHTATEARRVGIRECVLKDRIKELPDILRKYCSKA
jgi:DNA-binding NarL/FixJ family response regulator